MNLYTCAQVRQIDGLAIAAGIPAYELMQRAAASLLRCVRDQFADVQQLLIICGSGNNAGDGYELARQALSAGLSVRLWWLTSPQQLQGAAHQAAAAALADGVICQRFAPEHINQWLATLTAQQLGNSIVVDALLGTGAHGVPRPEFEQAIVWLNQSGLPVLAVDIPSGVNADTGFVASVAVRASCTLSLIAAKPGLYTGDAPAFVGSCYVDSLGVPATIFSQPPADNPSAQAIDVSVLKSLPPRSRIAHKGDAGRVLIVAGDNGFGGAAVMSAQAAVRSGAGTVSLITRAAHVAPVLARCPEIMVHAVEQWRDEAAERADSLLQQASSLVLGPGLGQSAWSHALLHNMLSRAVARQIPLVLDADALNLLALELSDWSKLASQACRARWIITPHPGEAARLLGCSTQDIRQDRLAAARALQHKTGAVVILKGAGSIVMSSAADVAPAICLEGNQAMASGGMGDILAGICATLLAQPGVSAFDAARYAVCAHGEAGDLAAAQLQATRGVLATDLLCWLPRLMSLSANNPGAGVP